MVEVVRDGPIRRSLHSRHVGGARIRRAGRGAVPNAAAGRALAKICRPSRALDGVARIPEAPTIAGESTLYLTRQLKAFRSGERKSPQMSIIAGPLSDKDIADLAA